MKKIVRLTESDLARIVRRVISENTEDDEDDFSEHQWKYKEMNKYGIRPHPKQLSGEWNYMQEYHKQVLIALFMDTKKRIKELEKLLASGEKSDLADAFQYELDLARKSNENLREKINTFDERYKNK
jgi:hypothetical protein